MSIIKKLMLFVAFLFILSTAVEARAQAPGGTVCEDVSETGYTHPFDDGYTWYRPTPIDPRMVCWTWIDDQRVLNKLCGASDTTINVVACVLSTIPDKGCTVVGRMPLHLAKHTGAITSKSLVTGFAPFTLYDHEVHHCFGWLHKQEYVRPVLPPR